MANLPSQHPNLSLHLTDQALATLITSARTPNHHNHLTALSNTALNAHETATRLNLGTPQRIIAEHAEGPILLQTFLNPRPSVRRTDGSLTPTTKAYLRDATDSDGPVSVRDDDGDGDDDADAPPMLVGIIVGATPDDTAEARRAAARLERVGLEIQGRWAEFQGDDRAGHAGAD